jgi:hypothetical protein
VSPSTLHPLANGGCPKWSKASPRGLTFAIDIVGKEQLEHLLEVKPFIRPRDIFVLRISGFPRKALEEQFPCNRTVSLVWPEQTDSLDEMLNKNPAIEGAALDWEGSNQVGSVDDQLPRIHDQVRRIRNHGLLPIIVPAGNRNQWIPLTRRGGFEWLFAQLQPACKNDAHAFAAGSKDIVHEAIASGVGSRNVAFEISMDSSPQADNHVNAERAATCTRAAYGKGARAIYIYGKKRDHLVGFFHELAKRGVRKSR